jgi:hypothetical protein
VRATRTCDLGRDHRQGIMTIRIPFARVGWLRPAGSRAVHALAHASAVVDIVTRIGALNGPDSQNNSRAGRRSALTFVR